jgi:predicted SnoaL-like aldol condensation-catalyzing enzyme
VERTAADVMRAMVAMFSSGDVARVADVVSAEYVDHQGLHDGPRFGPDGFAEVVAAARSGFAHLDVRTEDVIADDDRVAARILWRGERDDGGTVERETIDIIRADAGQATEHWGARTR